MDANDAMKQNRRDFLQVAGIAATGCHLGWPAVRRARRERGDRENEDQRLSA